MPLKKKKVLGRPLHLVPVRDRAALEIVKGKADECLTPSLGAWVAPKVRQSPDWTPIDSPGGPHHVGLVAALLGHGRDAVGERYYNLANSLEAGRSYQDGVLALRARLRAGHHAVREE